MHVTLRALPGAPRLRAEASEKVLKAALLAQRKKLAVAANTSTSTDAAVGTGKGRGTKASSADVGTGRGTGMGRGTGAGANANANANTSATKKPSYFQVVHFSILEDHVHLVVEASDKRALGRGIAGLEVRIARRLNAKVGRKGGLWSGRYHRRDLRTPTEVRGVLRYVLMNARKHYRHFGERVFADPCSSAPTFDGFSRPPLVFEDELVWPRVVPLTWLLDVGWRTHGLLDLEGAPASR